MEFFVWLGIIYDDKQDTQKLWESVLCKTNEGNMFYITKKKKNTFCQGFSFYNIYSEIVGHKSREKKPKN